MIPLGMFVLMAGLVVLQHNYFIFVEQQKTLDKTISGSGEIEKLKSEFEDYKKRVDSLTLKAGFKL